MDYRIYLRICTSAVHTTRLTSYSRLEVGSLLARFWTCDVAAKLAVNAQEHMFRAIPLYDQHSQQALRRWIKCLMWTTPFPREESALIVNSIFPSAWK